jgi:hypothetical protein
MDRQVFVLSHPLARRNAARACAEAPDGFRVEIKPRTRTLDQNALLWSCLTDIAKQVQWPVNGRHEYLTADEWKAIFSASLKQEQRMAMGLQGGFVMLGERTSRMSIKQMTELIDLIHAFGNERGVQWSQTSLGREFS